MAPSTRRLIPVLAAVVVCQGLAASQHAKTRLVSVYFGCVAVPYDAQVVVTESFPDAQFGYVQLPGDVRKVSWAAGVVSSRLDSASNFATTTTNRGDELRYVGFDHSGERGYIAQVGRVQLSIVGDSKSDLDHLLSIARAVRMDLASDQCARAEVRVGKPAF